MLVLALDTATPASTAALVEVTDDGLFGVVEQRTVDPRAHGEKLAPEIAAALAEAGVRPRDLRAIVAGVGPGPFTGLRVGLATAASMGQALGIPTYGVCSLDALGRAAGPGRVLVATDARRREVYFATYVDGERVFGPEVARPADVPAALAAAASTVVTSGADHTTNHHAPDRACGEGALKYGDVFGLPVEEHLLYPPGAALVAIAAPRIRDAAPSEVLTPLYLRRPDAVEPAGRKPVLT
ncbi:tRNA (adenosine(37)-N6)-threonylcarbamoyltransferase complex dimerization subunit type 1 TsaB [Actinoplanes sp. NPDC024001]|uniref:tRNA (adenosine(37)-N6)-threonylcarbamoyltransferase complex dimerization subunit type 1 TsaB n=1 Tax=Actinoplanes sp. NPDC024001 TaxID=3154598 RepID=UPI0033DFCD23